jgi:hypothetical protein
MSTAKVFAPGWVTATWAALLLTQVSCGSSSSNQNPTSSSGGAQNGGANGGGAGVSGSGAGVGGNGGTRGSGGAGGSGATGSGGVPGSGGGNNGGAAGSAGSVRDAAAPGSGGADAASDASIVQRGCDRASSGCRTVYAHTSRWLFYYDLATHSLVDIGPFNAPNVPTPGGGTAEDSIANLAVTPNDRIWVVSRVNLYTADATTGHVSIVGPLAGCGTGTVALTADVNGVLYAGDAAGAICRVDPMTTPPTVTQSGTLGGNLALAGDLVTVGSRATYGSGFQKGSGQSSLSNNALITLAPNSPGSAAFVGLTGFGRLFGLAYGAGKVLGFTGDGSGHVIGIDAATGAGTLLSTFTDPSTGQLAKFAGAGVSPLVLAQ